MLLLGRFKIYGHSMEPTLKEGQQVLASFLPYLVTTPKIGDLVVIYDPRDEKILVKRISKFGNKELFVAGENTSQSTDSRHFGPITKNNILAKIIFVF